MFDHVTIRATDRAESERFYDAALRPLGIDRTYRTSTFSEWRNFMLTGADAANPPTRRLRVAFVAPTEQQLEDFRQAGGGAVLLDPDGNAVEAVLRDDARRRDGIVDHLTLAVADVEAATRFYETVGLGLAGGDLSLVAGEPTEHLHIAFPTADDADVRRFHETALSAGYRDNGPPGERPRYHPGYYGAYVLDPDGNNVEVVNHHR